MSRFWHLFQPDKEDDDAFRASLADAHEILNFAQSPYCARLQEWLRSQWERPKDMGDHDKLVEQIARENTLKEVYRHLNAEIRLAQRVVDSQKEQ